MSNKRPAPIYPAYTFNESRTWFNWVKLTAADVHGLRAEPGFEGQNIYFHLNHPIRYVCVTGLVLSVEDKFNKYTLLELDDGSGTIVTIKITRLAAEIIGASDCPSNTTVSNVDIESAIGRYDVLIDRNPLVIGDVVKAKCTISVFRNVKQLDLKRIWILRSTAQEIDEWEEGAKFKAEVLSRSWELSKERLRELQMKEMERRRKREEAERAEERKQKLEAVKKVKRVERRREHEQRKEVRRKKEEELMNSGAIL